MSRTIRQIYEEAVAERNKRLELEEFSNDSKMSVLNGVAWMVAALIYTFESILDVFAVDVSETLASRINGTPRYYADALLNYQKGDRLVVREDGLAFGYANVDPSKRIITQVSYVESTDSQNVDSKLILKVATGKRGALHEIDAEELTLITAYINQLKFAGTRIEVISRKGDVLIPPYYGLLGWSGAGSGDIRRHRRSAPYIRHEHRLRCRGLRQPRMGGHPLRGACYGCLDRLLGHARTGHFSRLVRWRREPAAYTADRAYDPYVVGLCAGVYGYGRRSGTTDVPAIHQTGNR